MVPAAQSAWRQLVDLVGRGRAPADHRVIAKLAEIRGRVPDATRAASARALEYAHPPVALVRLLATDVQAVCAPVLRSARLTSNEWVALLPELSPAGRAVLRHRRDLPPAVRRALDAFGTVDFVLADETQAEGTAEAAIEPVVEAAAVEDVAPEIVAPEIVAPEVVAAGGGEAEIADAEPDAEEVAQPLPLTPFVSLGAVAMGLPVVAEAMRQSADEPQDGDTVPTTAEAVEASAETPPQVGLPQTETDDERLVAAPLELAAEAAHESDMALDLLREPLAEAGAGSVAGATAVPFLAAPLPEGAEPEGPYQIADVVARIEDYWRTHQPDGEMPVSVAQTQVEGFRFETDAKGVIRWVDGVSRAAVIGLTLDFAPMPTGSHVDGVAAGAFRRRAGFSNARMVVAGESDAGGEWRISAFPVFDPANGRFTGFRGTGRRPRSDERAEPNRADRSPRADSLRQLVHELRTPTNAIAGFAEMIEAQMLGPVPDPYRVQAGEIRAQARHLLGAIDDLDLAARIESQALALYPGRVALRPLLATIADDLAQLSALRGSWIALPIDDLSANGDGRAIERLLARLLATLVSASVEGEQIGVQMALDGDEIVTVTIDRPAALADYAGDEMLAIDDEEGGVALLGTGFALRLVRNLARELGGSLVIGAQSLTLRLPAAFTQPVEQAHLN